MAFKNLGEQGMCVSLDPSQVSNLLQYLNMSIKLPSHNLDVQKVVEAGISATSAPAAKQGAQLHRGGASMCAPKGNEAPAGEVPNAGGTKQQDSAVQKKENKAYNGSSPGIPG